MKTATLSEYLSQTEELIEEARAGRMFILVDDEDNGGGRSRVPANYRLRTLAGFGELHGYRTIHDR